MTSWHFAEGDTSTGPYSVALMERFVREGRVMPNSLVWNEAMPQWEPAAAHFTGFTGVAPLTQTFDGLYAGAPSRGFGEAVKVCLQKWITFRGRASRSELWFFALFTMLMGGIATALDVIFFGVASVVSVFNPLMSLALFLPTFAVSVRRLHDTDRSGWWIGVLYMFVLFLIIYTVVLLVGNEYSAAFNPDFLIPFYSGAVIGILLYSLVILIFYCIRGTPGPNRYG